MLFRRKVERSCSYCARAVRIDDGTMACPRLGLVPADSACRRFRYDPLKRIPEQAAGMQPELPEDADYSL